MKEGKGKKGNRRQERMGLMQTIRQSRWLRQLKADHVSCGVDTEHKWSVG